MEIPAAKAAVDKKWEKLEKISAWNLTKVRNKSEVIDEVRNKDIKVHFPHWWTSVIWKMLNWRRNTRRYCTQWQNHVWIQNFRRSNGKLPSSEKLNISTWSCGMKGHVKKCVERYCTLAHKTIQQLYKVSTPCLDDHQFKEEELKSFWGLSNVMLSRCSEMSVFGTQW